MAPTFPLSKYPSLPLMMRRSMAASDSSEEDDEKLDDSQTPFQQAKRGRTMGAHRFVRCKLKKIFVN